MATKPTISDVAARAGVSKGAVSLAMNDKPGVSQQTRQRVRDAAADLGFTPSRTARALASRRTDTFALTLTREPVLLGSDPFFAPFIAGIQTVFAPGGQSLTLRFVTPEQEAGAYDELAKAHQVDAAILADLRVDDPRPGLLAELGLPFVTLNRPEVASRGPAICLDDRAGTAAAVQHLIDLGHRDIAYVTGPSEFLHTKNREQAWRTTLRAAGIRAKVPVEADFTAHGGAAATEHLLDRRVPPTAILFANDVMAMAGLAVAHRRGIAVPATLSVVGYDDAELAAYLHPALSTVRTNAHGWGVATATALLDLLPAGGEAIEDFELPPATFIARASTGPPPTDRIQPNPSDALPSKERRT